MVDKERITFNQAWKKFLLIRPITRRLRLIISRDSEKVVKHISVSPFKMIDKNGEQYIIDDSSCPGIKLAFPKKIVDEALYKNIVQKLGGKTLSDEQVQIILSKLSLDLKRTDSRLGCANKGEIQQALSERNFWETLFSLHQLIEYRLHELLIYKSSEVNLTDSVIIVDSVKEQTCKEIKTFRHLVEVGHLAGAINDNERTKLLSFNAERDNIAHKLIQGEVTDSLLEAASVHGIELLNLLEDAFQRIVPKPEMIIIESFLVPEFI